MGKTNRQIYRRLQLRLRVPTHARACLQYFSKAPSPAGELAVYPPPMLRGPLDPPSTALSPVRPWAAPPSVGRPAAAALPRRAALDPCQGQRVELSSCATQGQKGVGRSEACKAAGRCGIRCVGREAWLGCAQGGGGGGGWRT